MKESIDNIVLSILFLPKVLDGFDLVAENGWITEHPIADSRVNKRTKVKNIHYIFVHFVIIFRRQSDLMTYGLLFKYIKYD